MEFDTTIEWKAKIVVTTSLTIAMQCSDLKKGV